MRAAVRNIVLVLVSAIFLASCSDTNEKSQPKARSSYTVEKLAGTITIDADWNKAQWQGVESLSVDLFMGEKVKYQPNTQAKLLYNDENIYVIFKVEDKYVRAMATEHFGNVWEDACVEFFFTPGTDLKKGYFNMETNALGSILLRHQYSRTDSVQKLKLSEVAQIEIAHSLPKVAIDKEIKTPLTWTIEYRLPLSIFQSYVELDKPAPGVKWAANFYKCAESSSNPHWATWSLVENETPDFHRPEFFGTLVFGQ